MSKPPYKVPSMDDIRALPWNGFNVVSTFSGAGGSCLGYRMAGYRVLWASEFIPAAQETYKLNHPNSILDTRDIRKVHPQDILDAIGMQRGEIDILDGSPPCASFSTAGKREKGWGQVKAYSGTKQRVDDLFFEYARILEGLQPKVFVAENVSGLVKGVAKGYFKMILARLREAGYNVQARVLDAQWLGVPQKRQRLIFVGVRNDIGLEPVHPKPLEYRYNLKDAIGDLDCSNEYREPLSDYIAQWWKLTKPGRTLNEGHVALDGKTSGMTKSRLSWYKTPPTVLARGGGTCDYYHPDMPYGMAIPEIKRICAYPDDFQLVGSYKQQWERLGRSVPPIMMSHIANAAREGVLCKIKS